MEINKVSQINAKSLPRFSKSLIVERMSFSVKKEINQDTLRNKSTMKLTKLTSNFKVPQIRGLEKMSVLMAGATFL